MNKKARIKKLFILSVCILGVFTTSGCAAKPVHEQSAGQKKGQTASMEKEAVMETDSEENRQTSHFHDLVYREYTIGSSMQQGEIMIERDIILQTAEAPKAVVVYFNDKVLTELPFEDEDITFELEQSGYYGFFVRDENDELIELSDGVNAVCDDGLNDIFPCC